MIYNIFKIGWVDDLIGLDLFYSLRLDMVVVICIHCVCVIKALSLWTKAIIFLTGEALVFQSSLKGNNLLCLHYLKQHVVKANSIGFIDE